jgi:nickel transport protein
MVSVLCLFLVGQPSSLPAQTPSEKNSQEIVTLLKEQNNKLSNDLRRIQREIAALRADLDKPGIKDVFAGIGYIFGLFGVAAFVASRRKEQ